MGVLGWKTTHLVVLGLWSEINHHKFPHLSHFILLTEESWFFLSPPFPNTVWAYPDADINSLIRMYSVLSSRHVQAVCIQLGLLLPIYYWFLCETKNLEGELLNLEVMITICNPHMLFNSFFFGTLHVFPLWRHETTFDKLLLKLLVFVLVVSILPLSVTFDWILELFGQFGVLCFSFY